MSTVHIRSGGQGTPAFCGQPLPGPQSACYAPATSSVCRNCLKTRYWQRHLAERFTITQEGLSALQSQEVA